MARVSLHSHVATCNEQRTRKPDFPTSAPSDPRWGFRYDCLALACCRHPASPRVHQWAQLLPGVGAANPAGTPFLRPPGSCLNTLSPQKSRLGKRRLRIPIRAEEILMTDTITSSASNDKTKVPRSAPVSHDAHVWKSRTRLHAARDGDLNVAAYRALIVITERMYGRRIESWPSYSLLSSDTGMCRRALQGGIARLVEGGYLRRIQYSGNSNSYRLSAAHRPKAADPRHPKNDPAQDPAPAHSSAPPPAEENGSQAAQEPAPEATNGERENRKLTRANQTADQKWG